MVVTRGCESSKLCSTFAFDPLAVMSEAVGREVDDTASVPIMCGAERVEVACSEM